MKARHFHTSAFLFVEFIPCRIGESQRDRDCSFIGEETKVESRSGLSIDTQQFAEEKLKPTSLDYQASAASMYKPGINSAMSE